MLKAHKKKLLLKRLEFVKDLEPNDISGYLFQDGVITENDKEMIDSQKTRRDRVEYLLDLLPRKGPDAFNKFCEALKISDIYEYLVINLQGNSNKDDLDCVDAASLTKRKVSEMTLQPRSASRHEPDMLHSYPMTSNPRGWCFIINNMNFLTMPDRAGSDRDAHNLQTLFSLLGFRVWLVNDVDTADIREKVKELANKHDHADSLVVCLLSHGLAGQIYGVDSELIAISEILDILEQGPASIQLKGKPKLFLIQACRSNNNQVLKNNSAKPVDAKVVSSSEVITSPINVSDVHINKVLTKESESKFSLFIQQNNKHLQSDLLLGYSTFPGEVSWRNSKHGSFFIDSVVQVFREYCAYEDVFSMLIKVNEKVLEKVTSQGQDQIPAPVVTLTKKLYFCPT